MYFEMRGTVNLVNIHHLIQIRKKKGKVFFPCDAHSQDLGCEQLSDAHDSSVDRSPTVRPWVCLPHSWEFVPLTAFLHSAHSPLLTTNLIFCILVLFFKIH